MDSEELTSPKEETRRSQLRRVTVEPAVWLLFFAWNVSGAVFTNQIIFQSCKAAFGFNETECAYLGTNNETAEVKEIEEIIQPYAANIVMARSLIESIIPACASLFIGPWSDLYGRRPVILATFCGYFLTYGLISIISFTSQYVVINPWFYIVAFLPAAISGGNCTLITGVFCYISDITNQQNRAVRMGILEAVLFFGLLVGSISSSYILKWTSATSVFLVATLAILIGLVYIIFCIQESVVIHNELQEGSKLRHLFKLELVRDLFRASCKRRPNYDRLIIWLTVGSLVMLIFAMQGGATVFFFFVRKKFEWTVKDLSLFESTTVVILIAGNVIGLFLGKRIFKMSDAVLGLIGFSSYMLNSGMYAIATQSFHLYVAATISCLRGIAGPMSRAILSTVSSKEDVGKIFSLTTSIESLSALIAVPLYTLVYDNTLDFFPGAFNVISLGAHFGCFAAITVVYILQNMYQNMTYTSIN